MATDIEAELRELQEKSKGKSSGFGKILLLIVIAAIVGLAYWYYFR